jgi:hypothetical protein
MNEEIDHHAIPCDCGQCNACAVFRAAKGQIDPRRFPPAPQQPQAQDVETKAESRKKSTPPIPNLFEGIDA